MASYSLTGQLWQSIKRSVLRLVMVVTITNLLINIELVALSSCQIYYKLDSIKRVLGSNSSNNNELPVSQVSDSGFGDSWIFTFTLKDNNETRLWQLLLTQISNKPFSTRHLMKRRELFQNLFLKILNLIFLEII